MDPTFAIKNNLADIPESKKEQVLNALQEKHGIKINDSENKIYNQEFLSTFEEEQLLDKFKQVNP